jgi:hypothetical protein
MPVTYPAVARGTERLRMNVTCDHRREDLDLAVAVLIEALAETRDERAAVAAPPGGEVTRDSSQHLISTIC